MKRIFTALAAVFILLCVLALAEDDGYKFRLNEDGTGYILYRTGKLEGDVTLPSTYNGLDVVGMDGNGWYCVSYFTLNGTLTIPDTYTFIGTGSFYGLKGTGKVVIPDSVTRMDANAFDYCTLAEIELSGKLTDYDANWFGSTQENYKGIDMRVTLRESDDNNYYFEDGLLLSADGTVLLDGRFTEMQVLELPDTVTSIGARAFKSTVLRYAQIPARVRSIGDSAFAFSCLAAAEFEGPLDYMGTGVFRGCKSLIACDIPTGITVLPQYTFYGSTIIYAEVPEGITEIGASAFEECKVQQVTLPSTLRVIDNNAFKYCTELTYLEIPDGVTTLGEYALRGDGIEYVLLPESVKTVDPYAFYGGTVILGKALKGNAYKIALENDLTYMYNASLSDGKFKYVFEASSGVSGLVVTDFAGSHAASVTIPSSYKSMPVIGIGGDFAAADKTLTSVTIPKSVKAISSGAFADCAKLSGVTMTSGVQVIGDNAFSGCTLLKSVTIPSSVLSIGSFAFSESGLTKVSLPSSVVSVGDGAFCGCASLSAITVDSSNKYYKSVGGVLLTYDGYDIIAYPAGAANTSYTLPSTVYTVHEYAFMKSKNLATVSTSNSTRIREYAFMDCKKLSAFRAGSTLRQLGQGVFYGCTGLKGFKVPSGVTSIGSGAFYGCTGITAFESDSMSFYVTDGILYTAGGYLTAYPAGKTDAEITLTGYQVNIEMMAFCGNKYIKKLYIQAESSAQVNNKAFTGCENLSYLELPLGIAISSPYEGCSEDLVIACPEGSDADYMAEEYGITCVYTARAVWVPLTNCSKVYVREGEYRCLYDDGSGTLTGSNISRHGLIEINSVTSLDALYKDYTGRSTRYKIGYETYTPVTAVLPESLLSIEEEVLSGTEFTEVYIPENCRTLNAGTFSGMENLRRVYIMSDDIVIADDAFDGCPNGIVLVCHEGSAAMRYAIQHEMSFKLE